MKQFYLLILLFLSANIATAGNSKRSFNSIAQTVPTITFEEELTKINENDGSTALTLTISETADATADISISFTNEEQSSFTLEESVTFINGGSTNAVINFTPLDNEGTDKDYVVILQLTNLSGATIGDIETHLVYVLDDEAHAPEAVNELGMTFSNNIVVNGAEIVTYDSGSQRLFISNAGDTAVEIIDFSDPTAMNVMASIILSNFGDEVTSVSAYQGIVAVAVRAEDQSNGRIVFLDVDGSILSDVEVGSLPDMVTFTPDGTKVLVANEGEPNSDYTIDPEGSVSIIDISSGATNLIQTDVTTLSFNTFDSQMETLKAAGVRIFGPNASVSQDLEPEYITVSNDSNLAYVSLQENNAYAIVDITNLAITSILPYGFKDHTAPENAFDASNSIDFIFMSTWNTLGMYQPDAIATYTIDDIDYIVTANEGDARDYDGFSEEERIEDLNLDPIEYPDAVILQEHQTLGRLKTTSASGDIDSDGDIDQIYTYGGRSFGIFNAATGDLIYDSGDVLERIIAEDPVYGAIFNVTSDENSFKNRSDDKGPEPEAVVLAAIGDQWYAFIGLERVGGIAVFNITNPALPTFETYVNNRDTTPDIEDPDGDLAPEGIIYIKPEDNATNTGLIVVANEVSSTIAVYALENDVLSNEDFNVASSTISVFPNPISQGDLYFSEKADYTIVDLLGRVLDSGKNASKISLKTLSPGIYTVNFDDGSSQKVIKN